LPEWGEEKTSDERSSSGSSTAQGGLSSGSGGRASWLSPNEMTLSDASLAMDVLKVPLYQCDSLTARCPFAT
jgi:hypothetical protein